MGFSVVAGTGDAELLENLGELPGRTDQEDRAQAPMTKRKALTFLGRR
jgi:hypothetical protein